MRNIHLFLCLFCIVCAQKINAQAYQDDYNPWVLGFGFNTIYDSGDGIRGVLEIKDNYNYSNPFRIAVEKRFAKDYGLEISGNFNQYVEGKNRNGAIVVDPVNFFGLDGMFKYYFTNIYLDVHRAIYEGYISTGFGMNFFNGNNANTVNLGLGVNYYISENLRLNGEVLSKISIDNAAVGTNILQINLGLTLRLYKSN